MPSTCMGSIASAYYVLEPSNWTTTPNTIMGDVSAGYPTAVKYMSNNMFAITVAVDPANSAAKRIWTCTDPRTDAWTGWTLPATFTKPIDIERYGSYYIAVGESNTGAAVCYRSINGSSWSLNTVANCAKLLGVFNADGKVFIFGKNTSGTTSYWHSTSGISWTQVTIGGGSYSNPIAFAMRTATQLCFISDPGTGLLYFRLWNINTHADAGGSYISTYGGGTPSGVPIAAWGDTGNSRFQVLTSLGYQYTSNPDAFTNQDWHQNAGITSTVTAGNHQIPHPSHNVGMHRNGRNVIFGDNATLRSRSTESWNGGFQLGNYIDASQTTTTATLDSAVKWGGTYASTLGPNGTWLAIGFSDATINASKKYNKLVYTDNPIW